MPKHNNTQFCNHSVSSRVEFIFHPVSESMLLPDKTRALVIDNDGYMQFAVWCENVGWHDEGAMCYSGGIGGLISDVVEFSLYGH